MFNSAQIEAAIAQLRHDLASLDRRHVELRVTFSTLVQEVKILVEDVAAIQQRHD